MSPPNHVELKVEYCEPGVKGNTATNVTKPVKVETGAEIICPGVHQHRQRDQDRHAHGRVRGTREHVMLRTAS